MAPSTTIPVPSNLTSTTPQLPTDTQNALLTHLQKTGAIPELKDLLQDSLARTGWTDRVHALALDLLRSGQCSTFPELMEEVLRRAKLPKSDVKTNGTTNGVNGNGYGNASQNSGGGAISVREDWFGPDGKPNVRIPETTVEAGVGFLKEKVKDVVEVVEDDSD